VLRTSEPPDAWRIHRSPGAMGRARFHAINGTGAMEHDSFLWSLADLMTLLLVFFIMLYSNAITRPLELPVHIGDRADDATAMDGDRVVGVFPESSLKMPVLEVAAGEERSRQIEASEKKEPAAEVRPADETVSRQMLADLKDSFSKDFYVRWEDRQPVIVLGERITFDAGEAILLVGAHDALKRVARLISQLSHCRVIVTGHTDDLPIHTNAFPSNWELSAGRAASVAKALMANGVSPGQLIIQGQAQFKPLVSNTTEENRRTNRRVEISLITG
jgi:chemotaxis protein MotB